MRDKQKLQLQSSVPALCDGTWAIQTWMDQGLQECEMQNFPLFSANKNGCSGKILNAIPSFQQGSLSCPP